MATNQVCESKSCQIIRLWKILLLYSVLKSHALVYQKPPSYLIPGFIQQQLITYIDLHSYG